MITLWAEWPGSRSTARTAARHALAQSGCDGTGRYIDFLHQNGGAEDARAEKPFRQPGMTRIAPPRAPAVANQNRFKVQPGAPRTLMLTAIYRNHFYIEKLLGNLVGLGRLMAFVAREGGLNVGALTVVSTHATIDTPKGVGRADIEAMVTRFDQAAAHSLAA
jgi:hypothetical protein